MEERTHMLAADGLLRQSIVSYFDHRKAEHLLRCSTDEMGITLKEVHALALDDTLDYFQRNHLGWSEAQVAEVIEAASRSTTDVQAQTPYDRVVVVEISERGDGLYWLDGQGDLSAPGDDLCWVALDANANPEFNLELLDDVKRHRLEPRFAAAVEEKIQEYQELLENTAEANAQAIGDRQDTPSALPDDDRFLEELQQLAKDDI